MNALGRLAVLGRLVVGGLFVIAGALKLSEGAAFVEEIANYQLLPEIAGPLAVALPSVEILAGALLLASPLPWRRAALVAIALLLGGFTFAMATALARGIDVSCGCFGAASSNVSFWTIARNLTLLSLVALVWFGEAGIRTERTRTSRSPSA